MKSVHLVLVGISCISITSDSRATRTFLISWFLEGLTPSFLSITSARRTGIGKTFIVGEVVSVPVFIAPSSLLAVLRCNCFCKVRTCCCSFFLSFLKAIACFWANDFPFLGRLPAVGVTALTPAPDPRAAGGCRRDHPFFTTGFSLK